MNNITKHVQIIERSGHPAFAVVPHSDWLKIRSILEDANDIRAYDAAKEDLKRNGGQTYPEHIAKKIASGEHPVAVIRAWRGLSQKKLADKAGLNVQSISHIETGTRKGGLKAMRKIADALGVSLDVLVD